MIDKKIKNKYKILDDAEIDKHLSIQGMTPLLSNAKWIKILSFLSKYEISGICIKLINVSGSRQVILANRTFGFDYFPTSFELIGGHYSYRQIEFISLSKECEIVETEIINGLKKIGKLHILMDEADFKIMGYLKIKNTQPSHAGL